MMTVGWAGKDRGQRGWKGSGPGGLEKSWVEGPASPPRRLEKHWPPVRSRLEKMSQGTRGGEGGPGEPEEGQEEGQEEGEVKARSKARREARGRPGGERWSREGPSQAQNLQSNPPKNLLIY